MTSAPDSAKTENEITIPDDSIKKIDSTLTGISIKTDSVFVKKKSTYEIDPKKSVWYSVLCPGLGQFYNRRYWKLPIVAAGIVSITYSISWNNKYYEAYTKAYRDITDNDDKTDSYKDLLPKGATFSNSYLTTVLKNRQKKYRRQRDLSLIAAGGFYLLCILDAYVDAQLYDFDISDDLTIKAHPAKHINLNTNNPLDNYEISLIYNF